MKDVTCDPALPLYNKLARVVAESRSGLCYVLFYVLDYDGQGLELRDRIQPVYSYK